MVPVTLNQQQQRHGSGCQLNARRNSAQHSRRCTRWRLVVQAAKITVNKAGAHTSPTTQSSSSSTAYQVAQTGPPPAPPGGVMPAVAGGIIALTGTVAAVRRVMQNNNNNSNGAAAANGNNGAHHAHSDEEGALLRARALQQARDAVAGRKPATLPLVESAAPLRSQQALDGAAQAAMALGSELHSASNDLLQRKGQLADAQAAAAGQADAARAALIESTRKAELLEAMVGALRERLKREEERNSQLSGDLAAGRSELGGQSELHDRISDLRKELTETQQELAAAQARSSELEARVGILTAQNAELRVRVVDLEGQLKMQAEAADAAAEQAEHRIRQLQADADASQMELVQLQGRLAEQETELEQLRQGERELLEAVEQSRAAAQQMDSLLVARDAEVGRLSAALNERAQQAAGLAQQATAKADARETEVKDLRSQLQDARLKAERDAARRAAELAELRSGLESQLGEARKDALAARNDLSRVKKDLDSLLTEEFLGALEAELRQGLAPGAKPGGAQAGQQRNTPQKTAVDVHQATAHLKAREQRLMKDIADRQQELAALQHTIISRLGPALALRAQELERAAARWRTVLRQSELANDIEGVQRAQREMNGANLELAALYRATMPPEVRTREKALRAELQDREAELRSVAEQLTRALQQSHLLGSGNSQSAEQLRTAIRARVRGLLDEREAQLQQQAAERQKQLQAQLQATVTQSTDSQRQELQAVQEAMTNKVRGMEAAWRAQLEASSRALQEATSEKQRLAAQAASGAAQVRQQLSELGSLRQELAAAQTAVAALRRAAEGNSQATEQEAERAHSNLSQLAEKASQLEQSLQEQSTELEDLQQSAAMAAAASAAAAADVAKAPPALAESSQPTPAAGSGPSVSTSTAMPPLRPGWPQQYNGDGAAQGVQQRSPAGKGAASTAKPSPAPQSGTYAAGPASGSTLPGTQQPVAPSAASAAASSSSSSAAQQAAPKSSPLTPPSPPPVVPSHPPPQPADGQAASMSAAGASAPAKAPGEPGAAAAKEPQQQQATTAQQQQQAADKAAAAGGFATPPISEWGKPKVPPPEAAASPAAGTGPAPGKAKGPEGTSGFLSEDELGAEIAAITKALVQRVLPGTAAAVANSVAKAASAAAAPPATAQGAAAAGTPARAPPAAPSSAPPRKLRLVAAGVTIPHIEKIKTGGEDAFFASAVGGGALGVADGVGGWAEQNIDPSLYARDVMAHVARGFEAKAGQAGARELMADAQCAVNHAGSCTACVALLQNGTTLTIANLGDSGARVVRGGSLLLGTTPQQHQFNMPYQLAHPDTLPDTDTAADARIYQVPLEAGDIIVLGSDGLFDNLWDEQLVALVSAAAAASTLAQSPKAAKELATVLATSAFRNAQDANYRSPWAVELANQPTATWLMKLMPRGGKMDDVTVVVGMVVPA